MANAATLITANAVVAFAGRPFQYTRGAGASTPYTGTPVSLGHLDVSTFSPGDAVVVTAMVLLVPDAAGNVVSNVSIYRGDPAAGGVLVDLVPSNPGTDVAASEGPVTIIAVDYPGDVAGCAYHAVVNTD